MCSCLSLVDAMLGRADDSRRSTHRNIKNIVPLYVT